MALCPLAVMVWLRVFAKVFRLPVYHDTLKFIIEAMSKLFIPLCNASIHASDSASLFSNPTLAAFISSTIFVYNFSGSDHGP